MRESEKADRERLQELMDIIADGVTFDGHSVREIWGDPPTITMLKKANYSIPRMLEEMQGGEASGEGKPANVKISFTIPEDIQARVD